MSEPAERRHPTPEELPAFFAAQPKILTAAGVVIRHQDGRVLMVRPTYRDGWQFPGGMVEAEERPTVAAIRETREEIGLDLPVGRLVSVAYRRASPPIPSSLQLVFDGGVHGDELFAAIRLDDFELAEWRLADLEGAVALTRETGRTRLAATFAALEDGTTVYLEDGVVLAGEV